ncbi:MAG: hypothetical protein ACRC92_05020 [Peptostreptococcaceae bacterium]
MFKLFKWINETAEKNRDSMRRSEYKSYNQHNQSKNRRNSKSYKVKGNRLETFKEQKHTDRIEELIEQLREEK